MIVIWNLIYQTFTFAFQILILRKLTWILGGNISNNSKSPPFYMFTTCIIYTNSRIFSKFKKIYYQVLFKVHRKKHFNAYTLTAEMCIEFIAFCTSEQIHYKITKTGIFVILLYVTSYIFYPICETCYTYTVWYNLVYSKGHLKYQNALNVAIYLGISDVILLNDFILTPRTAYFYKLYII